MTDELLKQDLIQTMMSRPTRTEAEVLAGRVVDLIVDMAKEIAEKAVEEHVTCDLHKWYNTEGNSNVG